MSIKSINKLIKNFEEKMPFFNKRKKIKRAIYILIAIILLIVVVSLYQSGNIFTSSKLRVCPEEMIVNAMPGIDRSGETEDNVESVRSSYYIIEGERREVDEFDTVYIAENCNVPVTSVY